MGGSVRRVTGGIRGLSRVLTDHGEAVEYDLITLGLRLRWLGTERLTWRDLAVIVRNSPQHSALMAATSPDEAAFGPTEIMLAVIEHRLRVLAWQNGGGKGKYPEMMPIPGSAQAPTGGTVMAPTPVSIEEMNARLGWS